MQNNDLVIKQNIFLFNLKTSPIHPVKAHITHIESVTYNSGLVSWLCSSWIKSFKLTIKALVLLKLMLSLITVCSANVLTSQQELEKSVCSLGGIEETQDTETSLCVPVEFVEFVWSVDLSSLQSDLQLTSVDWRRTPLRECWPASYWSVWWNPYNNRQWRSNTIIEGLVYLCI